MGVRELTLDDWAGLWPLVKGFGTEFSEVESRRYFEELVEDPRWVALGYDDGGELIGYAAVQDYGTHLRAGWRHHGRAAAFYEKLGYRGEPCPQPDYPTFEIDFGR